MGTVLVVACDGGGLAPSEELTPGVLVQAAGNDGTHSQGTELHGSFLEQASFSGASLAGKPLYNLRLEKGGLIAERTRLITGTTTSLKPCAIATSGVSRSCGFISQGVGTCRPGMTVELERSVCAGHPVVRVCPGNAPCEKTAAIEAWEGYCTLRLPIAFTCPVQGIYNVMAGAYTSGQSWGLTLAPTIGSYPARETLRGEQLEGAVLQGRADSGMGMALSITDIINARSVPIDESPGLWDPSGDTWLYRLEARSYSTNGGGGTFEVCGANPSLPYSVAMSGVYDSATGARSESNTAFTFSCDHGVIAKCYRWGYQPWKDAAGETRMAYGHAACTRMARADYCGSGTSYTQDGTLIRPWDELGPTVISAPASTTTGMAFEAGWGPHGAMCLSHWRWQTLQASCVQLTPPIYQDGEIINRCNPGEKYSPCGLPCASLCDTPEEAQGVLGARMFNESLYNNGANGVAPDAAP